MCQNQYENRFRKIVERYRKDIVIELTKIIFSSYQLKCAHTTSSSKVEKCDKTCHVTGAQTYIRDVGAPQAQCTVAEELLLTRFLSDCQRLRYIAITPGLYLQ